MIALNFNRDPDDPLQVLCLGAHGDDIEIGCGATVLWLVRRYRAASFRWVVFGAGEERRRIEAEAAATAFLEGAASAQIITKTFRDGFFPYAGEPIKQCFEDIKDAFRPDLIFTHYRNDLHQDHRMISELTWQTFRDALILEYEIPKWDGDLGSPNCYVPLSAELTTRKIDLIGEHFQSQRGKSWFSVDTFRSLMRLRGVESRGELAEAFYARKLVVS